MNSVLSKLIVISAVALMTQSASAAERIMSGNLRLGSTGVSVGGQLYDANLRSVVYNPPYPGPASATFGELSGPNPAMGVMGKYTITLLEALPSDPNIEVFPAWTAVAAPIPEPIALLLLVTGLAAVTWRAGRRAR